MRKAIQQTAPEPLASVPFEIPGAFETTLPNGLRVVIFEDDRLPLVSFRLAFLSGDANDPQDHMGLTSALTAMLAEGTENYSSRELAEKIERLGANLSSSSSDDFSVIAGSALSVYGKDILELIAELVFRPTFPENELDLYRRNTIENLKFQRSQPNFLANEQAARRLYGSHPYGTVAPKPKDVEKLSRESLVKFHKKLFIPNNAIFVAVGDVERDALLANIKEYFGGWPSHEAVRSAKDELPKPDKRVLTIVDRPGSAQANIVLANLAMERNHPDYFAATVMNQVLGAGASSRVFMNLREEKGYTYGAYTRMDLKKLAGDFEATAEVRTSVTGESLKEFFFELDRIRNERVTDEELADAKNFLTGVYPIRAETQEGLTGLIANQQLYNLPSDYLQSYREKIDAVTAEEVMRVANEYVKPDVMAIVIVGDAADILPQARDYADEIEIFDTDGHAKDIADYEVDLSHESANVAGNWNLSLDFQGQQVPVTLLMEQDGSNVSGKLSTMLGDGEISSGKVRGKSISAVAATEIQGQTVEFVINADIDGEAISGTISAAVIPDSLPFTGTREI